MRKKKILKGSLRAKRTISSPNGTAFSPSLCSFTVPSGVFIYVTILEHSPPFTD